MQKKKVSHIIRERDYSLRKAFLAAFKARHGSHYCENCKFPEGADFEEGEGILEVHHKHFLLKTIQAKQN